MSWQAYVDNSLLGSKKVSKAAIHGLDGNPWAMSAGFNVSLAEMKAIIAAFSDQSAARSNGLHAAGERFIFLRGDDRSLYGKKGATGLVCIKTSKAIIVGYYNDTIQPGEATTVIEKLGDYLRSVGY